MNFVEFFNRMKALKMAKKGRPPVLSANTFFPWKEERLAKELLKNELNRISEIMANSAISKSGIHDDVTELVQVNSEAALSPDFISSVDKLAESIESFCTKSFSNFSEMVVGQRYFPYGAKKKTIDAWKDNFLQQCKSSSAEINKKISNIVYNSVNKGRTLKETMSLIRKESKDMSESKAELIARTETAKLNSAISQAQQEEAGLEYYQWAAGKDGRTRESHIKMQGLICSWKDSTVYFTVENGKMVKHKRTAAMVKLHPGEDFNCRCIALPWDISFMNDYKSPKV